MRSNEWKASDCICESEDDRCYGDESWICSQDFFIVPIRWSENCYGISYFPRNGDCCASWGRYSTPEAAIAASRRFIDFLMSRCSNMGKYE